MFKEADLEIRNQKICNFYWKTAQNANFILSKTCITSPSASPSLQEAKSMLNWIYQFKNQPWHVILALNFVY